MAASGEVREGQRKLQTNRQTYLLPPLQWDHLTWPGPWRRPTEAAASGAGLVEAWLGACVPHVPTVSEGHHLGHLMPPTAFHLPKLQSLGVLSHLCWVGGWKQRGGMQKTLPAESISGKVGKSSTLLGRKKRRGRCTKGWQYTKLDLDLEDSGVNPCSALKLPG